MDEFCGVRDLELPDRKKPPLHCKLIHDKSDSKSVLKIQFNRVRKEGNVTVGTQTDFRTYVCVAEHHGVTSKPLYIQLLGES